MAGLPAESSGNEFLVGSHCFIPECSKLDFLPFRCGKCNQVFCLDHRLPSSHNCIQLQPSVAAARDEPVAHKLHPCSSPECSNREVVQIECGQCHKSYCFTHRHADDHQCSGDPNCSGKTVPSFHLPETVIKPVQPPGKPFNPQNPTAVKLRRMKLKTSAVGEKGIPEEDRIFIEIVMLDGSSRAVYLHKDWSVGRAMDGLKRFLKLDVKYDEAKLREKESRNEIPSSVLVKDAVGDGMLLEFHG